MHESRDLVPVAPLLVTIVAVAGLTSAVWWIVWQRHDDLQSDRVAELSQQLERAETARSQLAGRYSAAREARHQYELELQRLGDELDTTRQQLSALEDRNWPERYAQLERENYNLSEQVTELEVRNSITRDNYTAEHEQLQAAHKQLQQDFSQLDDEHTALKQRLSQSRAAADEEITALQARLAEVTDKRQSLSQWRRALERDLINRDIEAGQQAARLETLATQRQQLQAQLAASEQRHTQLSAELQTARESTAESQPPVEQRQTSAQPRPVPATQGDENQEEEDAGFRQARVASLKNAVRDSDSRDRKSIILTVLPTIPEGVQGTELADLVDGMDNQDIIAIIREGRPHISRPVDNDSYERIMRQLENEDSRRTVTRLLQ